VHECICALPSSDCGCAVVSVEKTEDEEQTREAVNRTVRTGVKRQTARVAPGSVRAVPVPVQIDPVRRSNARSDANGAEP
jgi:hypothetical protein